MKKNIQGLIVVIILVAIGLGIAAVRISFLEHKWRVQSLATDKKLRP